MEYVWLFLLFLTLIVLRVPIAVSLGLTSGLGLVLMGYNLSSIGGMFYTTINSNILMSMPGYIFAGAIMGNGGISQHLLAGLQAWIGHIRGGIAMVAIVACGIFAAITGSSTATVAAIGAIMLPALINSNYEKKFAMGLICGGGTLGILIPPSIPLILYSTISEQSVAKLFAAGIIPGIMMIFIFIIYIRYKTRKTAQGQMAKSSWGDRFRLGTKALWGLALPFIILGGIYSGAMTVAEASAVAVIYALFVSIFVYRDYNAEKFKDVLRESLKTSSMVMLIVTACSIFGLYLTAARIPHKIVTAVMNANLSLVEVLVWCNIIILIMGMFMEGVSIMLICAPLMCPIMSAMGFDLIQFGIIMTMNLELALLTPPVGMNLFIVSGITKEPLSDVVKGAIPFVFLITLGLVLVAIFPQISLFILRFM